MDKITKQEFMDIVEDLDKIEEIHEYFEKYEDRSDWDEQEKDIIREKAIKEGLEIGKKEGLELGKKEGIKEGIKTGKFEEKKEIAINLLNNNIEQSIISSVTGLSLQEINKLKS